MDTVVLDKTGTITTGKMAVTDIQAVPGVDLSTVLRFAGALEQASEHLLAKAITTIAGDELDVLPEVCDFEALPGLGARGLVDGHEVSIGVFACWDLRRLCPDL